MDYEQVKQSEQLIRDKMVVYHNALKCIDKIIQNTGISCTERLLSIESITSVTLEE